MTSSLVGSEMCIRDRLEELAQTTAPTGGHPPDVVMGTPRGSTAAAEANTCLLYTSDAADDM
eukprot:3210528-Prorocentrum_lima.AAC.1